MKKGYGAPTTSTIGEVGEKYLDMSTGDVYECTDVAPTERDMGFISTYELYNARFTWVKASSGDCDWNAMKNKPFYSEGIGRNLFENDPEAYQDGSTDHSRTFYLKNPGWVNLNKRYDITVRGDVYRNLGCDKHHSYYDFAVWGSYRPDLHDEGPTYPVGLVGAWPFEHDDPHWDADGNWIGLLEGTDNNNYPHLQFDPEKYPDLRPEEVVITEVEVVHTIDPKFIPNVVVTIKVDADSDGNVTGATLASGDFNTIKNALETGQNVNVLFKWSGRIGFTLGIITMCTPDFIWVVDYYSGGGYGIAPNNTVTLD